MAHRDIQVSDHVQQKVAEQILNGIEALIEEAKAATKPLEVDPYRARLFELFVTAHGAALVGDERSEPAGGPMDEEQVASDESDMSADGLCRSLARRWGLDMAARDSVASQSRLSGDQLEQMRLLWSVMRMWMEWNYAWCRWEEFHPAT
jgi:hypothetical protein